MVIEGTRNPLYKWEEEFNDKFPCPGVLSDCGFYDLKPKKYDFRPILLPKADFDDLTIRKFSTWR